MAERATGGGLNADDSCGATGRVGLRMSQRFVSTWSTSGVKLPSNTIAVVSQWFTPTRMYLFFLALTPLPPLHPFAPINQTTRSTPVAMARRGGATSTENEQSFRDGVILVLSTGYSMGCAAAIILNLIIPSEAMEVLPTKSVEEAVREEKAGEDEKEDGQEEPVVVATPAAVTATPVAEKVV